MALPGAVLPCLDLSIKACTREKIRSWILCNFHFKGLIQNIGLGLLIIFLIGIYLFFRNFRKISKEIKIYLFAGACYLLPIVFFAQPGLTASREYLMIGIIFLLFAFLILFWNYVKGIFLKSFIIIFVYSITLWGTYETIFLRDQHFDPSLVKQQRGTVNIDPGTKTFGYLYWEYFPKDRDVLVLHRSMEPQNTQFYINSTRILAFPDKTLAETKKIFLENRNKSIIITDGKQSVFVKASGEYILEATISAEGSHQVFIFSKNSLGLPQKDFNVENFNSLFDQKYLRRLGE